MREHLLRAYRRLPLTPTPRARLRYGILRTIPWAFPAALRPGLDPAQARPVARFPDRADWLVFGVIDWQLRLQRPQHLAIRLARAGYWVFYISSNLVPAPGPGIRVEPLDGDGPAVPDPSARLRGTRHLLRAPPASPRYASLSGAWPRWRTGRGPALRSCWWTTPSGTRAAQAISADLLVYDRMDYPAGFADWSPAWRRRNG